MRLRMSRYSGLMFALSKSKRFDLLSSVITRPMAVRCVFGNLAESGPSCESSASRSCRYCSACCCSLIGLLLLGGGLLPRKLRLRLRVRLTLLSRVALLSGHLRVRSRLRSLLSQRLRLLLGAHDQPAETFRLLGEPCHLALQTTDRDQKNRPKNQAERDCDHSQSQP